jgi:hypothetical protein
VQAFEEVIISKQGEVPALHKYLLEAGLTVTRITIRDVRIVEGDPDDTIKSSVSVEIDCAPGYARASWWCSLTSNIVASRIRCEHVNPQWSSRQHQAKAIGKKEEGLANRRSEQLLKFVEENVVEMTVFFGTHWACMHRIVTKPWWPPTCEAYHNERTK